MNTNSTACDDQDSIHCKDREPSMARIAEDLINVLLNKGLISASELPGQAVLKLNERANLRKLL